MQISEAHRVNAMFPCTLNPCRDQLIPAFPESTDEKFWRGFRQAKDIREREERAPVKSELLEKLRELITTGGHEAEQNTFKRSRI